MEKFSLPEGTFRLVTPNNGKRTVRQAHDRMIGEQQRLGKNVSKNPEEGRSLMLQVLINPNTDQWGGGLTIVEIESIEKADEGLIIKNRNGVYQLLII